LLKRAKVNEHIELEAWWKQAVIYQIYPRSFFDADGDGVGDLRGILQKLPYLVDLGIDAIWLSPVFKSPMVDFGYDISDYCAIDPLFGSMEDFDALLCAAHRLGMKLLLDLVPNHTSSDHPWFLSSRGSRTSAFRDWYIWRDPTPAGGPPNNWLSAFGGSGWEFDPETGQYYYHTFLVSQPDLNWRNPKVREAIKDVMRFWFDRGVDGFRMDALWYLLKDERFRDNPVNPNYSKGQPPDHQLLPLYTTDLPEVHEIIADLRRVSDEFNDRLLIGEIYLPPEKLVAYYGKDLEGVHLPFNFSLLETLWHARTLATLIDQYEAALPPGSWPNWVLGNHDRPRIASRVGGEQARVAAMLLLTLRGTPTLYNGDELGMMMANIPAGRVLDPFEINVPGLGLGRDGARSPMPWSDAVHAGFSQCEPWCPLIEDWEITNVANLNTNPVSILTLYRNLLAMRKRYRALKIGSYHLLLATGDVVLYERKLVGTSILIALNLGAQPAALDCENFIGTALRSTHCDRIGEDYQGGIDLRPHEGLAVLKSMDSGER
jgi:alpha-glucosidase